MISKRGGDSHLWGVILSGACLTALGLVLRHFGKRGDDAGVVYKGSLEGGPLRSL